MGRPGLTTRRYRVGAVNHFVGMMRAATASLIHVLLLIFAAVIAGFAIIGGAAQAWRGWTHHRGK